MAITNKESNFVSAVVYVKDQASAAVSFIEKLDLYLGRVFSQYEIIIVNDNSKSDEVEKLCAINTTCKAVSMINMSYTHGLETCMSVGVDAAIGDVVYEFNSVFSMFDDIHIKRAYIESMHSNKDIIFVKSETVDNQFIGTEIFNSKVAFNIISRRAINRVTATFKYIPDRYSAYTNCGLPWTVASFCVTTPINFADKTNDDTAIIFQTNTNLICAMPFLLIIAAVACGIVGEWFNLSVFTYIACVFVGGVPSAIVYNLLAKHFALLTKLMCFKKMSAYESIDKLSK